MTIVDSCNAIGLVNQDLCFFAQPFLHHDDLTSDEAPIWSVYLPYPENISYQDSKRLELLILNQRLTPDPDGTVCVFSS